MLIEEIITKRYSKKLDNKLEFIPITFDSVFMGIFERNLDILKRFLIVTLNLEMGIDDTKIEILNNKLPKENIKEYQKRVDILVVLNDVIFIDIEINRRNLEKEKLRNTMYCDKLYSMILESGDKASKIKDVCLYQLNLNTWDKAIAYGEDIIVACSLTTKNIFVQNKYIVLKHLEFYRKLYYTGFESLGESGIWLAALTATSLTELEKMLSYVLDDYEKNRILREAIRVMKLNFSIHEWEKDKMDELVKLESKRVDQEEAIEQKTFEIVKSMFDNNIDLDTISKVTKKSLDEIKLILDEDKEN